MKRTALFVILTSRLAAAECFQPPAVCAFDEGRALLATDPAAAALKFHASYKLSPTIPTLAMYARALEKAKDYARAVEAWERVIAALERELAAERTERVSKELDAARFQLAQLGGHVGRVTLRFPAGTAQPVIITRKREGENTVSSSENLPVNAGGDTLRLTYPDARTQEIEIIVAAGNIEVYPVPDPVVRDEEPADVTDPPPRTRWWLGVGAAGAGTIVLGAAAVFAFQARSAQRDADANCDLGICSNAAGQEATYRAHDRKLYAIASAVGGGALLVTGIVLLLTDREDPKPPALRASITSTEAMCTLQLAF